MRFVDTNVLIYAVSARSDETAKRNRARELQTRRDLTFSTQVLQEFYVQSTRPSRRGALTHDQAVAYINSMLRFSVQLVTLDTLRQAFRIRERSGYRIGTRQSLRQRNCRDATSCTRKT